jgi:peptidoglycan/xylan/chitin deacetylase (PgdA/CDA1 family)
VRIPGAKLATSSFRRLRSRVFPHGLILGYHRVVEARQDPYDICVSPRHFAEHLEVLRRCARPMRLWELVEGVQAKDVRSGAVAITFDDGYADLLANAKPLLDRNGMPATVFVVAGALGGPFWWDELAALLGTDNGMAARPGEPQAEAAAPLPTAYHAMRLATPDERERRLTGLRARVGPPVDCPDPLARCLTASELTLLARDGLVTIGAHTLSHASLARLPLTEQQREIRSSKLQLEGLLGEPIRGFSYPDGSLTEETVNLVKRCDFRYACASQEDAVWSRSDAFRLPRLWPGDWDGAQFEEWLQRWL